MRIIESSHRVELTRRNLLSLLAKLDGYPKDSACTIARTAEDGINMWYIHAVEDSEHYTDQAPGAMVHETEVAINPLANQDRALGGAMQTQDEPMSNPPMREGDRVRLIHSYGREGIVSSVADDGVMVCLLIAHRYQLRGPFSIEDVTRVDES